MRPAVLGDRSRAPLTRPAMAAAICIVLMGAGGLAAQETAPASQPAGSARTVSNVFVDTDLREALQDIASQLEVVIVPDSSVSGVVTCELKEATLDRALEIVLAGTGFLVKEMPGYYLVCSGDPTSPSFVLISETRVVKLNHLKAPSAVKLLAASFKKCVQADPESNTVCITAPPALLERIVADLNLIDRPLRHIMLNARIVILSRADLLSLGVQWTWPKIEAGIFTSSDFHGGGLPGPDWPWGLRIGYTPGKEFTNSLLLTLNLLEQNDEATIIASPQLMAQDGKEAEIKVATEEYFEIVTQGYYTQTQLEKIETGTVLKITPRIGEAGDITLEIMTEVSDVIARGEGNLPVVTRRIAKSTVRIEDGGTAAIAGLTDSRTQTRDTRVPGLSDLPLIGRLFQDDAGVESSHQVAVFVTGRVMPQKRRMPDGPLPDRPAIKPVGKKEFDKDLMEALRRLKTESQVR